MQIELKRSQVALLWKYLQHRRNDFMLCQYVISLIFIVGISILFIFIFFIFYILFAEIEQIIEVCFYWVLTRLLAERRQLINKESDRRMIHCKLIGSSQSSARNYFKQILLGNEMERICHWIIRCSVIVKFYLLKTWLKSMDYFNHTDSPKPQTKRFPTDPLYGLSVRVGTWTIWSDADSVQCIKS